MAKTDEWLQKVEKELEKAKENGQISESVVEIVSELRIHQSELEMQNEELRQSQEEYAQLYNKYLDLYNDVPVGYFALDKEGIIRNVNDKGAELLQLDKEKIMKRGFSRFIPKAEEWKYYHALANSIDTCKNQEVELQLKRDGTLFDAHMEILPLFRDGSRYRVIITDITKRKKAEEREKLLKTLMDNNPSLVFMKDKAGKYVYLNKSYEKQFIHSKDWYGKTDFDFWPKESAELFQANDTEVLESGKIHQFMEDSTDIEGTRYVWLNYKFPFTDSKNKKYVGGIGIDVTDRVYVEEALKESEEKYRHLLQFAPTGIYEIDYNGPSFKSLNDAMPQILGYSREELMAMNPMDLLSDDSKMLFQERIQKILNGEKIDENVDYQIITKDGHEIWANLNIKVTYKDGKPVGALVIAHDITERKKAEEMLYESEELYRGVVENTTAIILRINPQGIIQFANERALDFFGYSEDDLIGKHVVGTIVPETDTAGRDLAKMVDDIAENPDSFHSNENENMLKNDERVWMEWTNSGIYDTDGNLKEFLSVGIDATERKKAENALKESEAELQTIIENLEEGLVVSDMDGNFTHWNPTAIKMHGFSSIEEGIRKFPEFANIFELSTMDGNVLPVDQWPAARILRGEYLKDFEVHIRRINSGWERIFKYGGTLVRDAQDQPLMAVITLNDITESQKAVNSLKESEQRFRSVLDNSLDAIYRFNLKTGQYDYLSPAFVDVVGYPPKEFMSMTPEEAMSIIHPDDLSHAKEALARLAKEGHVTIEYRICDSKGKYRWLSNNISLIRDNEGQTLYRDGTIRDVTKQKKNEEELRKVRDSLEEKVEERTVELEGAYQSLKESELKAKERANLLNITHEAIFVRDMNNKISFWNKGAEELYGWTKKEAHGNSIQELLKTEFPEPLEQIKIDILNKDRWDGELIHEKVDGTKINVLSRWSLQRDKNYNPIGILEVNTDITGLKKAEKQLKETITELERSNQELQSFAYITSHDLQEPLRTMGNYAGLLKHRYQGQLDEDADDFLEYLTSGAARMKEMVQGLLDYSRVGTRGGEFKEFNSEDALNHAVVNLKSSIDECHAEITHDSLPDIVADESQIQRVFQNLIGNALKFHKEGVQPEIHISASKEDDEYVFSVSDNGIGIEEQYSDRIFEVFKRLHAIGEYQGAGIGLAIVKRIIDRHWGRVWVGSELGKGSTFYFTIPINK